MWEFLKVFWYVLVTFGYFWSFFTHFSFLSLASFWAVRLLFCCVNGVCDFYRARCPVSNAPCLRFHENTVLRLWFCNFTLYMIQTYKIFIFKLKNCNYSVSRSDEFGVRSGQNSHKGILSYTTSHMRQARHECNFFVLVFQVECDGLGSRKKSFQFRAFLENFFFISISA